MNIIKCNYWHSKHLLIPWFILLFALFFPKNSFAVTCDLIMKHLTIHQLAYNQRIQLSELINRLGPGKLVTLNQQILTWGNYQLIITGNGITQIGEPPAQLPEVSAKNLDQIMQQLGKPDSVKDDSAHLYSWYCPKTMSSITAVFDNSGKLFEFNSRLCYLKEKGYDCPASLRWQNMWQ